MTRTDISIDKNGHLVLIVYILQGYKESNLSCFYRINGLPSDSLQVWCQSMF
jgi:hypothetical protein